MRVFTSAGKAGTMSLLIVIFGGSWSAAEECTQPDAPIETDRPDITNSSIVIPAGSVQNENGINLSQRDGARLLDGTNTRLRFGVASCLEVIFDMPSYVTALRGAAPSGFTDFTPAVKRQISPIPGKVDLSVTLGVALPTGATGIAGPGLQPYLQFPWSVELNKDWELTGMVTNFFTPSDPTNHYTNQSTFVVERQFGERAFLFAEYVGEFLLAGGSSHLFNSGGGLRITPLQQIDFHVGIGLNHKAPAYIAGIGYSFRLDRSRTPAP